MKFHLADEYVARLYYFTIHDQLSQSVCISNALKIYLLRKTKTNPVYKRNCKLKISYLIF